MSEINLLEYLFENHKTQVVRESDLIVLYIHACLLDRKLKLDGGSAVLPSGWNSSDPINLTYITENNDHIIVGVTQTNEDIFVSVTEDTNNRLGSLDFSSNSLCRLSQIFHETYPNLNELRRLFEENVWNNVFPKPANSSTSSNSKKPQSPNFQENPRHAVPPARPHPHPYGPEGAFGPFASGGPGYFMPPEFDYGRADLDPLGRNPLGGLRGPPGFGSGGGGMLFDPRRSQPSRNPDHPDLIPPGSVPPGARYDPIGPPRGGNRGRRPQPDPDNPLPPGWDDMYM